MAPAASFLGTGQTPEWSCNALSDLARYFLSLKDYPISRDTTVLFTLMT
jgi:hypothetical protein